MGATPEGTALLRHYLPSSRAAERVYAVLKEGLLEGAYRAGERIRVEAVSEQLEVSKQPVMESLRRLSAEGFVIITPQVGCSVLLYDQDEVADFFELMASIDGEIAAMAAARRTATDLDQLRAVSARIGALLDEPSIETRGRGYRILNRDFHGVIHAACYTEIVRSVGGSMMDRADFFINSATSSSPLGPALAERHADHEAIVAAIAERDTQAAGEAASRHIATTVELIRRAQASEGSRARSET